MINALCDIYGGMSVPEGIQFTCACLTLPLALRFIWLYAKDPWWRTRFGRSLMLIAAAIALYSLSSIMFRLFGPTYWGRPVLLPASGLMTLLAMVMRNRVLSQLQRADRERIEAEKLL